MIDFQRRRTARDDRIRRAIAERDRKVAGALSMHAAATISAEIAMDVIRSAYAAYEVAEQDAWDDYRAGGAS
ncbi:MAG TPA: hypothetical protein VF054_07155 [Micromonosporaceae bacterium]